MHPDKGRLGNVSLYKLAISLMVLTLFACSRTNATLIAELGDSGANQMDSNIKLKPLAMQIGAQVYAQNCAVCHGADLKGIKDKHTPNLTDDVWLYGGVDIEHFIMKASDVEFTIAHGIRADDPQTRAQVYKTGAFVDMPARGEPHTLELQEISDVADFILWQQGHEMNKSVVARGRETYDNEGGCFDCHGHDARGDNAVGAPNLARPDTFLWGNDRSSLIATITNGHSGNSSPAFVNKLSPTEIRATAVYVLSHAATRKF